MERSPLSSGAEIEAAVISKIYREGGQVSIPFDHGMGYDLVSDFAGALNRIEVKRAYAGVSRQKDYEGSARFEVDFRARNMSTKTRLPSVTTSDFFVVEADGHFYIIPTFTIEGRTAGVLRPPGYEAWLETRPAQINFEDFRETWNLLHKEV